MDSQQLKDYREQNCENNQLSNHLTNFSIDEILKPDFGVRKVAVRVESAFVPVQTKRSPSGVRRTPDITPPHPPEQNEENSPVLWPAWVYCTRYSDRPSAGPRSRKTKRKDHLSSDVNQSDDKRPRTAFTTDQLTKLKQEFDDCRYLTEQRRRDLAASLELTEAQIKIWFQNKRAKLKKASGMTNPLAMQLMAQGLYNHTGGAASHEQLTVSS